ncbi:MAG: glycosyltransferase family 4 protein [Pseudodesulfovibrio sp.]|uniref:Glycosyl transferase group 1 n=1 Tax=Pseudodesulfovibrio aespoeensis (strain ATCC 700646 / DSM 10631 / Aspo-2) TaxID=643562 RepID=E6VUQ6_PSEA9|nr:MULTISPECIES: glycosyltransferase family 4 protein [Pseudodesulfovibrio]MBU4192110.1 glycosyltransferase family 4 protein [Pseudomonadota bacterium]ADU62297.1 glycosyl transferase group 1 [Pseudodesulfovibrio aespoeensis Aspo-2]MBU4245223.1 glycosyltransferase family 4 protein [Pseudomonadota bacterium]MBU4378403.1 glycosyltransferase family 4 protein [Pseudomonadota bacterium]MBU4474038.1 glycosyltransferase family 4 protein [Pseudomonadota bacterium]
MKTVFLVPCGTRRSHAAYRVAPHVAAGRAAGLDVCMLEVPASGFARYRFFSRLPGADVIVVHRELISRGELRTLRRLAPKLVYDFADAVWTLPAREQDGGGARRRMAMLARRFRRICAEADLCLVENMAQAKAAAPFQDQVRIVPTPLDAARYAPRPDTDGSAPGHGGPIRVGWMVTGGDRHCLGEIVGGLADKGVGIQFSIVSDSPYDGPGRDFVFWSLPESASEIARLQTMDIGLAPYPDDGHSQAVSGLDVLRYMACGVVVVASDKGGAGEIVDHGIDGFLARDIEEWTRHVLHLARDHDLRHRMAEAARLKVVNQYGLASVAGQLWDALGIPR